MQTFVNAKTFFAQPSERTTSPLVSARVVLQEEQRKQDEATS
jgi:hypothetical protein